MTVPEQSAGSDASASQPSADLTRLQLALDFRRFHHDSIWEEQKHFTWLISILLSAALIAVTSDRISSSGKDVLVLVASVLGFVLALTAFRVQRREGVLFTIAQRAFVDEWNAQFTKHPLLPPRHDGDYRKVDGEANASEPEPLAQAANRGVATLIRLAVLGRAGVRDYFQTLFLFFAAAFVLLGAYQLWREWPLVHGWLTDLGLLKRTPATSK